MIVQDFILPDYLWKVRVYYAVRGYWTREILEELRAIGCNGVNLSNARDSLVRNELNTGLTYSNYEVKRTLMVISLTTTPAEFLNSWSHEMRHLSRHVEQAFSISPYGEEAAYLAGTIAQKMFPVAKRFLCEHCRQKVVKHY